MQRLALIAVASLLAVGCASAKPVKTSDGVDLSMELNIDRPGDAFMNTELPSANVALCKTACAENLKCAAYTYIQPGLAGPNARCQLKAAVGERVQAEGYISGVKTAIPPKAEE